jgi:prepilin-type N-terminal cleavage/methylation domain-containing protein
MTTVLPSSSHCRSGFTLLEVMIASLLFSVLAIFLSGIWCAFGPGVADITRSARHAQDIQHALESLRRDLSGNLIDSKTGAIQQGQLVGCFELRQNELHLCFDGGLPDGIAAWAAPDSVIRYRVEGDQLVRFDSQRGQSTVVASHVEQLEIKVDELQIEVKLRFAFPYDEPRTNQAEYDIHEYRFIAHKPRPGFVSP